MNVQVGFKWVAAFFGGLIGYSLYESGREDGHKQGFNCGYSIGEFDATVTREDSTPEPSEPEE